MAEKHPPGYPTHPFAHVVPPTEWPDTVGFTPGMTAAISMAVEQRRRRKEQQLEKEREKILVHSLLANEEFMEGIAKYMMERARKRELARLERAEEIHRQALSDAYGTGGQG